MYSKILVPLDGSTAAESALPLVRSLARRLELPVELLGAIDLREISRSVSAADGLFLDRLLEDESRRSAEYLDIIAKTLRGLQVTTRGEKGEAAEVIIETAAADKNTLIVMATHGRSGLNRFLLGSIAEKVLRATANPLLLVKAVEPIATDGEAALTSIVVPLDGSDLAEGVLPMVEELAKKLDLEVVLMRAFAIPYGAYSTGDGFYDPVNLEAFLARLREETFDYLERKTAHLKRNGLAKVSFVAKEGLSADEIIKFARETPANLVAMSTHGRSGVKRWVLGSVTETVVRHSGDPVLVLRAAD
ncbi:MAG: universal stress protein [Candidatus Binatia bacterium]